ncbi:MAG: FAD-binding oxidoreductase, partial [Opitutales bacterium]|nr:FAD-binding oxidoreductase [Opitutales bacterium]
TATTRPHLGAHPACGALMSFNGFGSKGFALSPYFARHFADWIFGKTALDPEADLSRHIRKFWRPLAAGIA